MVESLSGLSMSLFEAEVYYTHMKMTNSYLLESGVRILLLLVLLLTRVEEARSLTKSPRL